MKYLPSVIVLFVIPIYVLSVFVADVFAPTVEGEVKNDPLVLQFVGDMMFDRYIRERAEINGYETILFDVQSRLKGADIVVGNLEGPITSLPSVSDWRIQNADYYRFTFATSVAAVLKQSGFTALALANNHIMNFGEEGYRETLDWLDLNTIGYFGQPNDPYTPWRYIRGSSSVALYAFDVWYARDTQELTRRIQEESQDTFVVVYAHWGDEYEIEPNNGQRALARRFVESGADLIVGTHPHVIQTKERYRGAWIYYSLGNFVFDQYFDEMVRCGAGITVTVESDNSYMVDEFFVELSRDGTTKLSSCEGVLAQE